MNIEVPFGRSVLQCSIPEKIHVNYGRLQELFPSEKLDNLIAHTLDNLIGEINIEKLRKSKTVAIAVSDITRPVPSRALLENLLPWLNQMGIKAEQITVIIGGGLHRPATSEDFEAIFGPQLLKRLKKVVAHNADQNETLSYLGQTTAGTPVYVNREFAIADYKIVIGLIDAHQFMGFTGGVKGAVIGLGGRATITANHANLFKSGAEIGHIENNPARKDLEEAGKIIGIDMILNVILNAHKQVLKVVAGHPLQAHRVGVEFAKKILGAEVKKADIVISSPGGYPKDVNVYQTQKALASAEQFVKKTGTIILVAECKEGVGDNLFLNEMSRYRNPDELIENFLQNEFVIGPHKAYLWCKSLAKNRIVLVTTGISQEIARTLMVDLEADLQTAVNKTFFKNPAFTTVAVLPNASSIIPI